MTRDCVSTRHPLPYYFVHQTKGNEMDLTEQATHFLRAGQRAADYLATMQRPNGAVTGDDFPMDIFHKLPYAFSIAGKLGHAQRLSQWVKTHRGFTEEGAVNFYLEPVRMQIYKHAWFIHGTQRIGRFDLSYPAFQHMLKAQHPCGGFACEDLQDPQVRALTTGWCGVAAIYMNRLDVAEQAAEAMITMLESQPDPDRFYFFMTGDGQVIQEEPDSGQEAAVYKVETFIDSTQTDQFYWEIGMAMILLARLYQVTGKQRWLDYAMRYFEFNLKCQPDSFAHANAGKNGMGAALIYMVSGDDRARDAAVRECEFLMGTQEASGAWVLPPFPEGFVTRLDLASEYCIWLHETASILYATA